VSITRNATAALLAALSIAPAACGKKGPPLEPLRLVPATVAEVTGRRAGQTIELRFSLPTANVNGPGSVDLDRVEIYAVTVGPGTVTPPNRDVLTKARVVGTIAVKPAPVEGAPEPPPTDKRPSPGDRVTFVEELTEEKMKPVPAPVAKPAEPAAEKPVAPPAAEPTADASTEAASKPKTAEAPPPPTTIKQPLRIYVVRGFSRAGRPGPPSTRVSVPLVSAGPPPSAVLAQMPTEKGLVINWTPPVAEPDAAPLTFNVYRSETPATPLNKSPLTDIKFEVPAPEYGREQCFVVRTIQTMGNVTIEGDASPPGCLTPVDKFAPAAPKGLRAVAEDGGVNLVWEPNTEADLAGYVVLRGEAPLEPLPAVAPQPITPQPIKEANYRDTTAQPGVRYVYSVVAVDAANPRNASERSASEAVTAR
jgi:hypothetical protein